VKDPAGYRNLMEIFNRKEVRSADGLVAILIPAGPGGAAIEGGDAKREAKGDAGKESKGAGAGQTEGRETGILAELREKMPAGDLYLGCEFANFRRAADMSAREGPASSLPLVWAGPLKFVGSPDRLILPPRHQRRSCPPERRSRRPRRRFRPGQEAAAPLARFGTEAKEALAHVRGRRAVRLRFEDIVPPLPAGLFPKTLRETKSWRGSPRPRTLLEGSASGPPRARGDRELGFRAVRPHRP
jgi:hypothetical protein